MKDSYGRTIDYMRVSITDRCNLRCRYCMPDGISLVPMREILTFDEIEMICQEAAKNGIRKLKVTGGEPLVRLGCVDLVRRLKGIPGIEQVTMTTNGLKLSDALPELTKNGLDAVNISLDTLRPETYRAITGRDGLLQVLASIDRALESGLKVKINTVFQRGINDCEWRELAELTRDRALDVRFIEMMPIGCGRSYETIYNENVLHQLADVYPEIREDRSVHGNGPAVYYKLPGAKGSVGFISAMHGKFCADCNRIRLTSQGQLKLCLCYENGADLRTILRETSDEGETRRRLGAAIRHAVERKPQAHCFEDFGEITEKKKMVQIGG